MVEKVRCQQVLKAFVNPSQCGADKAHEAWVITKSDGTVITGQQPFPFVAVAVGAVCSASHSVILHSA